MEGELEEHLSCPVISLSSADNSPPDVYIFALRSRFYDFFFLFLLPLANYGGQKQTERVSTGDAEGKG